MSKYRVYFHSKKLAEEFVSIAFDNTAEDLSAIQESEGADGFYVDVITNDGAIAFYNDLESYGIVDDARYAGYDVLE